MKTFGAVVTWAPSILKHLIIALFSRCPGRINSHCPKALAADTHTTKSVWKFPSAEFGYTLIGPNNTTTLQAFFFWMNPVSSIFHNWSYLIPRLFMFWHSSQKNIFSPTKLASFLFRLMTWKNLNVNYWCRFINWSHHYTSSSVYLETYAYYVCSTIIFTGFRVSDFAGNLCAQKLNKAYKKRSNITGVKYFCGLWCFVQISRSAINLFSFIIYSLPHNLRQLSFSPNSAGQDTDAVVAIAITCPFFRGVHRSSRRSCIQYAGGVRFLFQKFLSGRQIQSRFFLSNRCCSDEVGHCRKFLIHHLICLINHPPLSPMSP